MLTTAVLVFVFSRIGKVSSGEAPYMLMVFCGMLPWMFFSTAVATGGESLVNNASLVSKVYFPKLIVPLSSLSVIAHGILIRRNLVFLGDEPAAFGTACWRGLQIVTAMAAFAGTIAVLNLIVRAGSQLAAEPRREGKICVRDKTGPERHLHRHQWAEEDKGDNKDRKD